jgi:pyruvate formate-lyase activating enzyme-like uncharacterized protein
MEEDTTGSFFNYLPQGCRLCYEGAKMVLFITGTCKNNCYYCPVSDRRRGKDLIFANEREIEKDQDIIEEAVSMDALGTGITGGEPLLVPDRVIRFMRLLKKRFGDSHHIHLYTSLAPDKKLLESLRRAGLDEIRFHPPQHVWADIHKTPYRESIISAHELGLCAGFELPALPADFSSILALLDKVDGFLNLNELEFSETNAGELKKRGYVPSDDVSFGAAGSREAALSIDYRRLHFCSSIFKDAVQLRERFKRTAKRTARDFDEITEDGTLVYGAVEGGGLDVLKDAGVTEDMYAEFNGSIETAWWIASDLAEEMKKKGCSVSVIERYPTKNGFIVEKTPL